MSALHRSYSPWVFLVAGALAIAATIWIYTIPLSVSKALTGPRNDAGNAMPAQERGARAAYFYSRRGFNFGVPPDGYRRALEHMHRQQRMGAAQQAASAALPALSWTSIGPKPLMAEISALAGIVTGTPLGAVTGRVTALVMDPTSKDRVFIGTGGGGVWMGSVADGLFVPISDALPTQSIGSLALDYSTTPNPTLYVGTGEGNGSGDAYYGQGIFITSDLGASWRQLGASKFQHASIAGIAIDRTHMPRVIYAAVTYGSSANRAGAAWIAGDFSQNGLWRSADGGKSWIPYPLGTFGACPYFTNDPCPAQAVAIDPSAPGSVLVAILATGIFHSSDGGYTFTQGALPGLVNGVGRISLAAQSGSAYAMVGAADGIEYSGFYFSWDAGNTWRKRTVPSTTIGGITIDGTSPNNYSLSFFDQALAIDAYKPTSVVFGGVGVYRTMDTGNTWSSLIPGSSTHSDQHAIAFDRSGTGTFYLGNDGGLYRYNDPATWTSLNATLAVSQAQSIAPNPYDNARALASFQDNGVGLFDDSVRPYWSQVDANEAAFVLFDPVYPQLAYHSFATGSAGPSVAFSSDGGDTFDALAYTSSLRKAMFIASDRGAGFYPPLAGDPGVSQRVMFGAHSIFVSRDGMWSWNRQTLQDLTGGCTKGACAIQDIEIAQADRRKAYSLSIETDSTLRPTPFKLFTTDEADLEVDAAHPGGGHWIDKTMQLAPLVFPDQTQATGIAVNPFDASIAYLCVSGFTSATGIGHVFVTTDFGGSWSQADGNPTNQSPPPYNALPDVPVMRLLVDRNDPRGQTVLAATDIGVFITTDGGADWEPLNVGMLSGVPVADLQQNQNGVIFAATRGRGVYQLTGEGSPGPSPTPVRTSTRTATSTPTRTIAATPTPIATLTATHTATVSRTATRTVTRTATRTATPTATRTPTRTPTRTSTRTPTKTATRTATRTPTRTSTRTPTKTATRTATRTPTRTSTRTPTRTATRTATRTPTRTRTATATITKTPTPMPTTAAGLFLSPDSR
ncbi:MAG: hypothetical protein Q7S58_08070 [Candidatus Binatus sp.]|uniref:WD40/YVTN/BNR-like repeat-containing protein n=1 Tax=Candidatus Binatus sp. TaxID=2811406 RepID=UPI00272605B1|nr:hypothetical protein [Candidatus Binatus sp.]MDO8432351.1 hypothetical protein [Candidatus Binatus sp.]